ncbi:MAG TPA: hypothetical protein VKZ18_19995 [Polyangia bacterium]|nr:hypothetical protein [Polyangia bacterium]
MTERFAWAMGLFTVLAARPAAAVGPTCFPVGGGGVPFQPGLPDWWTGTAPYDDPRWIHSYGYSAGPQAMNALVDTTGGGKALVLRWHVTGDGGGAAPGDQVYVGFYNPTTTVGTVFQFTRDALVNTTAGVVGAGVMSANAWTQTGTGGWSSTSVPATVSSQARLDAFCDSGSLPVTCDEWIIRLRVPTTAAGGGVDVGDTFAMWFELDADHAGTATTDILKFPAGAATFDPTTLPLAFPPPLGGTGSAPWTNIDLTGTATCAPGVDLQAEDITVQNALGTGTTIDINSTNNFHVRPTNATPTTYAGNAIQARLRIADWGSSLGANPQWDLVPDPSCAAATGPASPTIPQGGQFDLSCSWTLTPGQQCDYGHATGCTPDASGFRFPHQCIIADLTSPSVIVPFSTSSAWNNFDFGHASKLDRLARINIGTLTPRDVYVYIQTNNMPAKVEPLPPPGQTNGQVPARPLSAAARERMGALASAIVPGRVTEEQSRALQALVVAGKLRYSDVAKVMPTYTAYVWNDSGTTVKTKSGNAKLLSPQPSFTLFVSHDGDLDGWKHSFAGANGATVTEIAHNFYRIHVGHEGRVEVLTSIEAVTPGEGPGHQPGHRWWWILIVILLLVLVVALVRRK